MGIWFDMTNSMKTWKGANDAGIIRAELEIAKNLHSLDNNLRFFFSDDVGFEELKEIDLKWLWDAEKISDAYVARKGIKIKTQNTLYSEMPERLRIASEYSDARIDRIRRAREIWLFSLQGKKRQKIAKVLSAPPYRILKCLSNSMAKKRQNKLVNTTISKEHKNIFHHPFLEGDILFSCGFFGSNKEEQFSKLKACMNNVKIGYLIYDMFYVKKETAAVYAESHFDEFTKYLSWISNNCDYIVYGGETAQIDAENFFKANDMNILKGFPIKFGSEIVHSKVESDSRKILSSLGIEDSYILAVGSIIAKKNYNVIYKAYKVMENSFPEDQIPTLVIVGGKHGGSEELIDVISTDEFTKIKIKLIQATDEELDALYKNTLFTILPSMYEGWSLTLPESLGYGKFCIASDVAPLREIGKELIDYANPHDPIAWANKIMYYINNQDKVHQYSENIKENWVSITWRNCGEMILGVLKNIEIENTISRQLYYDMLLTYHSCFTGANVSGILRTQLLLARYLSKSVPTMKFCVFLPSGCIVLDKSSIAPILSNINIEKAFKDTVSKLQCQDVNDDVKKQTYIQNQRKEAMWMLLSVLPKRMQKLALSRKKEVSKLVEPVIENYSTPFQQGDVVFSSGAGMPSEVYEGLIKEKDKIGFKFVQLIYDFTPTLLPQVHRKETREFYGPFLKNTNLLSDVIFYGGETAKRDGAAYECENKLVAKPGIAIKFGSDIVHEENEDEENEEKFIEETLKKYGIKKDFIMAVGSIEIRKNHETLYRAYHEMLAQSDDIPQMLFCGYPGWKTAEFCAMLQRDKQVKGKIILIQPSDRELSVLYKKCLFTVLASLYEGWSLTLPESLNYGKFCICNNCDPLKEIGQEFVDYVDAFDSKKWAERILYYYQHLNEVEQKEAYIAAKWHAISWSECANQVNKELQKIME